MFPCQTEPAHAVAFDPKEFSQIIRETVRWEKREKAWMLAETEAMGRMLTPITSNGERRDPVGK